MFEICDIANETNIYTYKLTCFYTERFNKYYCF